ncbi:hemolysin family protein [Cellulomonas marina]|uniref:Putative hemolysin n=1 Tax=Cellulomonas marina TaxID=988821 RepID=A0A1I1AKI8_9CELL|nr:hemolysin family protein [Cellulomonas marina]GIG30169.1 membrane protein [Cellulomonas marina]SFB38457.1 putative hemolysin [Cellulomonas marina]
MDSGTLTNLGLVLVFIVVGGVFAGTELALVSLRESQLRQLERDGGRGAKVAAVARDPNRFLAAVQIGVTVAGFFSAAYGASTLAPDLAPVLVGLGLPEGLAQTVALVALTLVVAFLSLVLGELVPKRIALQRSAAVARLVGPPLDRFAQAMRPVIWLLSVSTDAVVRLFGGDPSARSEEMTNEELRDLVVTHRDLPEAERRIVADVFDASDRSVKEVMRPRGEVAFLAADLPVTTAREQVAALPYSRYPVTGEDFDDVLGFLHVRDLLVPSPAGATVRDLVRPVLAAPSTNRVLTTMATMRREGVHLAVVVDEYGGTDGIVTLEDLVEELVGEIRDEYDAEASPVSRTTGSVDAGITIEELAERTGVVVPEGPYETAAGYVLWRLGRLARVGDVVPAGDEDAARLEVVAVDRRRITRLRVVAPTNAAGLVGTAEAGTNAQPSAQPTG